MNELSDIRFFFSCLHHLKNMVNHPDEIQFTSWSIYSETASALLFHKIYIFNEVKVWLMLYF